MKRHIHSKALLYRDFDSDWYRYWAKRLKQTERGKGPFSLKANKFWQNAAMAQALYERSMLEPEKSGIGFGVGKERLPALFANMEVLVTATDQSFDKAKAAQWDNAQLAKGKFSLNEDGLCPPDKFEKNITFKSADMNKIPKPLLRQQYDFLWSNCALGHLGSIEKSLAFIENSLGCLKPGGYAVHTTEAVLNSDSDTLDNADTVFFRQRDFRDLFIRLTRAGYEVEPLSFRLRGDKRDDQFTLAPVWGNDQSKLLFDGYFATQVILIIHKPVKKLQWKQKIQSSKHQAQYRRNLLHIRSYMAANKSFAQLLKADAKAKSTDPVHTYVRPLKQQQKIKLKPGAPGLLRIGYENRSTSGLFKIYNTLKNTNPAAVSTANPANHPSVFQSPDWRAPDRPNYTFTEKIGNKFVQIEYVKPKQTFYVEFNLLAPRRKGSYQDTFCLIKEMEGIIPYTEVVVELEVSR